MKTIYIDGNFICHTEKAEGRMTVETEALDHVCDAALRYYVYVPVGSVYKKGNGVTVNGEFIQCVNSEKAASAQLEHEIAQIKAQNAEYEAALSEIEIALGV